MYESLIFTLRTTWGSFFYIYISDVPHEKSGLIQVQKMLLGCFWIPLTLAFFFFFFFFFPDRTWIKILDTIHRRGKFMHTDLTTSLYGHCNVQVEWEVSFCEVFCIDDEGFTQPTAELIQRWSELFHSFSLPQLHSRSGRLRFMQNILTSKQRVHPFYM